MAGNPPPPRMGGPRMPLASPMLPFPNQIRPTISPQNPSLQNMTNSTPSPPFAYPLYFPNTNNNQLYHTTSPFSHIPSNMMFRQPGVNIPIPISSSRPFVPPPVPHLPYFGTQQHKGNPGNPISQTNDLSGSSLSFATHMSTAPGYSHPHPYSSPTNLTTSLHQQLLQSGPLQQSSPALFNSSNLIHPPTNISQIPIASTPPPAPPAQSTFNSSQPQSNNASKTSPIFPNSLQPNLQTTPNSQTNVYNNFTALSSAVNATQLSSVLTNNSQLNFSIATSPESTLKLMQGNLSHLLTEKEEHKDKVKLAWTEHTSSDGRKYYFNSQTRASQWDKPDELKTPDELKMSLQTPWKEYSTASGRVYWYNKESQQSVWDMPEEIKKLKQSIEEENNAPPKPDWPKFEEKGEAREHLKILFDEKKFLPKTTWETALKQLEADKRWNSLVILTKGEKKQAYSEYMSQAQRRFQEEERRKRRQARELVLDSLNKWEAISPSAKYSDYAEAHHEKEWWNWIDEKERDQIFQDYMNDYMKKSKETRRKKRKENMELLRDKFEKNPEVTLYSRWKTIKSFYENDETFKALENLSALISWEDFVKDKSSQMEVQLEKTQKRQGRKYREAYLQLLDEYIEKGEFNAKTSWVEFNRSTCKDTRYLDLLAFPEGSTPRELYEEKLEQLMEEYSQQKSIVNSCVRQAGLNVGSHTTFDMFYEALRPQSEMNNVSVVNAMLTFNSILERSIEKEKEAIHKENKRKKKLHNLLNKLLPMIQAHENIEKMDYQWAVTQLSEMGLWEAVCEMCPHKDTRKSAISDWLTLSEPITSSVSGSHNDTNIKESKNHLEPLNINLDAIEEEDLKSNEDPSEGNEELIDHERISDTPDEESSYDHLIHESSKRKDKHKHRHHHHHYSADNIRHRGGHHKSRSPSIEIKYKKKKRHSRSPSQSDSEYKIKSKKHRRHS